MIDLNTCKAGQRLKSKHGLILTYLGKMPVGHYYDHEVYYPDGGRGTRTNDGFVYRNEKSRLPTDHDIVEIMDVSKCFALAASMQRTDSLTQTTRTIVGYKYAEAEATAVGEFAKQCLTSNPGFSISDIVTIEVKPQ